jgi:hypothetical protein
MPVHVARRKQNKRTHAKQNAITAKEKQQHITANNTHKKEHGTKKAERNKGGPWLFHVGICGGLFLLWADDILFSLYVCNDTRTNTQKTYILSPWTPQHKTGGRLYCLSILTAKRAEYMANMTGKHTDHGHTCKRAHGQAQTGTAVAYQKRPANMTFLAQNRRANGQKRSKNGPNLREFAPQNGPKTAHPPPKTGREPQRAPEKFGPIFLKKVTLGRPSF